MPLTPRARKGTIMTDEQYKVLSVFFSNNTDYCYPYRTFVSDSGLDLDTVKKTMKELKALGYVKVHHGLMTEEGEVAGSGFGLEKYNEVSDLFDVKEKEYTLKQLYARKSQLYDDIARLEREIAEHKADTEVITAASPDPEDEAEGSQNANREEIG
jgi:DNA-binding transcriptional MocR family regulator